MAINAKILLDPKFYYQKLNELVAKSKVTFRGMGDDAKKAFKAARDEMSGANTSFQDFAKSVLLGGGVFSILQKGAQSAFNVIITLCKRATEAQIEYLESFNDVQGQFENFDKKQQKKSGDNKTALSTLSELQMSDAPLNNVQKEQQRQTIETLRKSYRGLNIDIDAATGKIKNFEDVQSQVLSGDQKKELDLVQRQIRNLEKQNGVAAVNLQNGGSFSDAMLQLRDHYLGNVTDASSETTKRNANKLMELREREWALKHSNRAADAATMYQTQLADRNAERAAKADTDKSAGDTYLRDSREELEQQIQVQELINQGKNEEAKRQQLINDLKKRGIEYDAAAVDRLMALNEQLGAQNLLASQKEDADSLYTRALRAAGQTRQTDQHDALKRARTAKGGGELDDAEKAMTLRLAELTQRTDGNSPDLGNTSVSTNDLTARGGFAGGAVMPEAERVNREIADYNRQQLQTLGEIERICKQLGVF